MKRKTIHHNNNLSRFNFNLKSLKSLFLSTDGNKFHIFAPLYNMFCRAFSLFGLYDENTGAICILVVFFDVYDKGYG